MHRNKKFIPFGAPYIREKEIREVVKTLKSGWLTTGPKVHLFEELIKQYTGATYACALHSCTGALHLSLLVGGIGEGDEVITSPTTFGATSNTIIHVGAKPVFVDIDRSTMNIDSEKIEQAITKKTKAIIPVHMAGRPCDMKKIQKIAKRHKLIVIEDAAHAIGASYHNRKIGNISDLTCFSFYAGKNIVTGEGGMVTTNNKNYADKIRVYSLHGMTKNAWNRYSKKGNAHYDYVYPGYKYNMMDLQAAIGIHQMTDIETFAKKRKKIWDFYNRSFAKLPIELPAPVEHHTTHAMHLYTLLIDKKIAGISRDEFILELKNEGVGSGIHFKPMHLSTYYKKHWHYQKGDFPNAEYVGERVLSLPCNPSFSLKDIEHVARSVTTILNKKSKI